MRTVLNPIVISIHIPLNEYWFPPSMTVQVSRYTSAYVNVQDDNGILVGNWSGNYTGGKSPLEWSGSAEILNEFNRYKRPVRYAQCWVFSGVLTTGKEARVKRLVSSRSSPIILLHATRNVHIKAHA